MYVVLIIRVQVHEKLEFALEIHACRMAIQLLPKKALLQQNFPINKEPFGSFHVSTALSYIRNS